MTSPARPSEEVALLNLRVNREVQWRNRYRAAGEKDAATCCDYAAKALLEVCDEIMKLDHASLTSRVEELERALEQMVGIVDEFHQFCAGRSQVVCGDPDYECPIGMGEWVSAEDKAAVESARALLPKGGRGREE